MTDNKRYHNTYQSKLEISKTSKIEYLISENKHKKALKLIDEMIEKENNHINWNLKGIILDNLSEYDKSVQSYNEALKIKENNEIKLNKSNTLYKWAKITYFPEGDYEKALKLINEAINTIPDENDPSEYYFLKGEILETLGEGAESKKSYLTAYKEYDKLEILEKQINYLKNTNDTLISITGCQHYNYTPAENQILYLKKETDNEHDKDAIAIYLNENKVGYVANSDYTLIDEVESASKIKNKITDNAKVKILFKYLDMYYIGKLL